MNQALRHIGRTLAIALPVVLVLSGTLAVSRVSWVGPADDQMETASAEQQPLTPEDTLRDRLLLTLRQQDPSAALTGLQEAVTRDPSLAPHCAEIAQALGAAAVEKYGSSRRAQQHSRPVCDTSFAAGVAAAG
ncbi:hypothetical protein [Streptomyces hainanensis]|uniref:Uncharacterized protein n=1 Tax=Streptomyces hainanensis TaxID=402648 RepID=A0A4R4TBR4_9ACTN|nr:hypothetical protein [Streptomyces hainanensis]TDC72552.1 hypothetical protein E1283_21420 [Streptomyces hainanensis]